MWAKCLVPVCGWNSWQPLRLSRGERDIASPANTAIAPNTDIALLFHVFASSLGCYNRTVSSESCISAWPSHKSDQYPSTTAQVNSAPLESIRETFYQVWKQVRLENCLWQLDFTGVTTLLSRCLSSPSQPCHWHLPQEQRTALLLRQNRAEGITTQGSSSTHTLLSVQVSLLTSP